MSQGTAVRSSILSLLLLAFWASPSRALYPEVQWARNLDAPGFGSSTTGNVSISVQPDGDVVVAGVLQSWFVLSRYDAAGNLVWMRTMTGASSSIEIAPGPGGSILVAGSFTGTIDFGGGPIVSVGGMDIVIAKLDAGGGHVWSRGFGSAGDDAARTVIGDAQGHIFVAGTHAGVDFGGGTLPPSGNSFSFFVVELDGDGAYQSSRSLGWANVSGTVRDMAVADSGRLFVTGSFTGTANVDGALLLTSNGSTDGFVVGYESDGSLLMIEQFGDTRSDTGQAIAVAPSGDVLLTGSAFDDVTIASHFFHMDGFFLACYGPNGLGRWARANSQSASNSAGYGVAPAPGGGVVVMGFFSNTLELGTNELEGAGNNSFFAAHYNNAGTVMWAGRFGNLFRRGGGVACDAAGNVFASSLNRAGMTLCTSELVINADTRGFVLKLGPNTFPDALPPSIPVHPRYDGHTLRWDASSDPEGSSIRYTVVAFGPYSNEFPVATTTNTFVGVEAEGRSHQYFAIRAEDCVNHVSGRSDRVEVHPSWTRPRAPVDLEYDGSALSWLPSGDLDVSHYVVHDSPTPNWDDPARHRITMTAATFLDVSDAGAKYFFVTAIDSSGLWGSEHAWVEDDVAPAAPTGFVFTGNRLFWDESTDPGFDHFDVFASTTPTFNSRAVLLATTDNLNMHVPVENRWLYYFITQTDIAGNTGPRTRADGDDAFPPEPVAGLIYSLGLLRWNASPEYDLCSYKVFGSNFDPRDQRAANLGTVADTQMNVSHTVYRFYYVTAVDCAGNESADASTASGIDNRPSSPTQVAYHDGTLTWTAPSDDDLDHFAVYGSDFSTFDVVRSLFLLDTPETSLDVGEYEFDYFYVLAVDQAGQVSPAAGVKVPTFAFAFAFGVHPNPTQDQMTMRFTLPHNGHASIHIFDVTGTLVATVLDSEVGLGDHSVTWDGRVPARGPAAAGIYFARLEYAGRSEIRKIVLIR